MSKRTLAYTLCGPTGAEVDSGTADTVKELGQALKAFVKAQAGEETAGSIRFEFRPVKKSKDKKKAKAEAKGKA